MSVVNDRAAYHIGRRAVLAGAGFAGLTSLAATARAAPSGEPIKIGVIAEISTIPGAAIPKSAQMAVEEINAKGGVLGRPLELVVYDDHVSSSDAVRAFQRLVNQDKAVAVLGTSVSEIALVLEPWSARLKMPFIATGAASDKICQQVHDDYDRFKYTFQAWLISFFQAKIVADSARDILVDQLHMKSCVVMSENAAWTTPLDATYLEFLPKAGLKVLDVIRFSPDTTDFTPIYNKIEAKKPDVIMVGWSHVGVVPTVQWAEGRVPIAIYGANGQASSSSFWADTHGACEGMAFETGVGPDSAITPKTLPFTHGYHQRYGALPAYCGYTSYDMVFAIADAIARMKSTAGEKLVAGLEATNYLGVMGRIRFYGPTHRFTHAMEYGLDLVPGVGVQWQQAKQKTIWPVKLATAKVAFPSFVKLPA